MMRSNRPIPPMPDFLKIARKLEKGLSEEIDVKAIDDWFAVGMPFENSTDRHKLFFANTNAGEVIKPAIEEALYVFIANAGNENLSAECRDISFNQFYVLMSGVWGELVPVDNLHYPSEVNKRYGMSFYHAALLSGNQKIISIMESRYGYELNLKQGDLLCYRLCEVFEYQRMDVLEVLLKKGMSIKKALIILYEAFLSGKVNHVDSILQMIFDYASGISISTNEIEILKRLRCDVKTLNFILVSFNGEPVTNELLRTNNLINSQEYCQLTELADISTIKDLDPARHKRIKTKIDGWLVEQKNNTDIKQFVGCEYVTLERSVLENDIDMVGRLLRSGIGREFLYDKALIQVAIKSGFDEVALLLLSSMPFKVEIYKELVDFAKECRSKYVSEILAKKIEEHDVVYAIYRFDVDKVKELIAAGAVGDIQRGNGGDNKQPLVEAVFSVSGVKEGGLSKALQIVNLLLDAGLNPKVTYSGLKWSLLHFLARVQQFHNPDFISLFVRFLQSININQKNDNEETPLHQAIKFNNINAIVWLTKSGAKISFSDHRQNNLISTFFYHILKEMKNNKGKNGNYIALLKDFVTRDSTGHFTDPVIRKFLLDFCDHAKSAFCSLVSFSMQMYGGKQEDLTRILKFLWYINIDVDADDLVLIAEKSNMGMFKLFLSSAKSMLASYSYNPQGIDEFVNKIKRLPTACKQRDDVLKVMEDLKALSKKKSVFDKHILLALHLLGFNIDDALTDNKINKDEIAGSRQYFSAEEGLRSAMRFFELELKRERERAMEKEYSWPSKYCSEKAITDEVLSARIAEINQVLTLKNQSVDRYRAGLIAITGLSIPNWMRCKLTGELLRHPITLISGHTCETGALQSKLPKVSNPGFSGSSPLRLQDFKSNACAVMVYLNHDVEKNNDSTYRISRQENILLVDLINKFFLSLEKIVEEESGVLIQELGARGKKRRRVDNASSAGTQGLFSTQASSADNARESNNNNSPMLG